MAAEPEQKEVVPKDSVSAEKKEAEQPKEAAAAEASKQVDAAGLHQLMGKQRTSKGPQHKFWANQPVPQGNEECVGDGGSIDGKKKVADVRPTPYDLPEGLEWFQPDITDPATMERVYQLLRDHYVEDDDAMFRFNYSVDFLKWALLAPKYKKNWHVAIISKEDPTGELIGFITGIPVHIRVNDKVVDMCEINFLCVNKRTRDRELAPTLIQEVTRRVNLEGIWQAIYTAGIVLPTPIARCQYWHRSLNPQKLIQIGFSSVPRKFQQFSKPMDAVKRHYKLPDKALTPGLRPMVKKDHKAIRKLLEDYLKKFKIAPVFTNDEIVHWFLPKNDVIDTYVVEKVGEDGKTKEITDVLSFYSLPSTIIGEGKHKELRAAYSYYNVATSTTMEKLMNDALILARAKDFDVFNALDIMENKPNFDPLKFGPGDGHLQYYLYNYRVQPSALSLIHI